MKSLIFILILITTSIFAQVGKEWKIDFKQNEGEQASVALIKGRFVEVKLQLTKLDAQAKNTPTVLSLVEGQGEIKTGKASYIIDPKETTTPHIHIGIPCNSAQEEGKEATINFKLSTENYEIPELKVKYTKGEVKEGKFIPTSKQVGIGTYGNLMVQTHGLLNYDPILLTFRSAIGDFKFAEVKPLIIDIFNGESEDLIAKTQYLLRGDPPQVDQVFDVQSNNACFSFPKTFSFKGAREIQPVVDELVIPIIKSSRLIYNGLITVMNIEMNFAIYPIEHFCVVQDTRDPFVSDEQILDKSFIEHPTRLKYESVFVSNRGVGVTRFAGLSHFHPYKMKCIFQTALIEPTRVSLSFGYSPDSDIKISLETDEINPTSSQCITWTLMIPKESEYKQELFEKNILSYCYDFCTDYSKARIDNGCLECVTRDANEVYPKKDNEALFSMCIKSKDNCESLYSKDISIKAEDLRKTLITKEDITKSIGSDFPYEVVSIATENDDKEPNVNLITVSNFVLKANQIEFQLVTQEQKPLECFVLAQQRSTVNLSVYEFDLNKIYIPDYMTASKTFIYQFPNEEWDERLYNFIVLCYNIPFFTGNYKHTPATVKIQFLRSKSVPNPIREKPFLPRDCNNKENALIAECMKISHHSFMKFESKISRIAGVEAIKAFFNQPPHKREQVLQGHVTDLQTTHTVLGKFNAAMMINDLMEMNNCQTAIRYDDCRKIEKRVQEEVIDSLFEVLGNEAIIDNLTRDILESEKGNQIKRAVMTIFLMINNSGAFTLSTTEKLLKIMKNIYDHFDKLLALVKDDKIKNDIVNIIAQYLSNFSDIITYNEVDNFYKEIDQNTHFNPDKIVLSYLDLVRNFTNKLVESNAESGLDLDKITFRIAEITKPSGNAPSLRGKYNFQDHLNFTFDVFAKDLIQVHVPHRELYNNFKVRKLAFVFYEDFYPLVSYKYQSQIKIKSIFIKAYDANNKEIVVNGLKGVNRLGITFKPDNGHKHCYYYDKGNKFENKGLESVHTAGAQELLCIASNFSEFSSGSFDIGSSPKDESFPLWGYYTIGVVALLLIIAGIGAALYFVKQKRKLNNKECFTGDIPNEALINEG